jgi:hypothetical protein
MYNRPISSREYKLMLNVEKFSDRSAGVSEFLRLADAVVRELGGEQIKVANSDTRRTTCYLDVGGNLLRANGFILRIREEAEEDERSSVTLKYRGFDRYVSAAADLRCSKKVEYKLQEDILPAFVSRYSHSVKREVKRIPAFATFADAVDLFPGLAGLELDLDQKVAAVNGFFALEIGRKAEIAFGDGLDAASSVSFWYDRLESELLAAEFAFDYPAARTKSARLEQFDLDLVNAANEFFAAIQAHKEWFDFDGTTKTAFAYRGT